jgi:hypothetical protein
VLRLNIQSGGESQVDQSNFSGRRLNVIYAALVGRTRLRARLNKPSKSEAPCAEAARTASSAFDRPPMFRLHIAMTTSDSTLVKPERGAGALVIAGAGARLAGFF